MAANQRSETSRIPIARRHLQGEFLQPPIAEQLLGHGVPGTSELGGRFGESFAGLSCFADIEIGE